MQEEVTQKTVTFCIPELSQDTVYSLMSIMTVMRQHLHMDIKHGNVIWQMIMEAMKWK